MADVRLADRVFAPHYAAPMPVTVRELTIVRESADASSPTMTEVAAGGVFEVLELAGTNAWGIACDSGLVGYINASAIAGKVE
ncbi:SH3 domain-containing protein [Sphingomonas aliaeris]|uniref:SH3 domain-containing protein n=1 Tax=Sphingomonas aliaeris TaxID=2759526 RepID=A0A974NY25_9SPHN|nr:SH3 domain-containing protein [Sphingomonas aliaeris]